MFNEYPRDVNEIKRSAADLQLKQISSTSLCLINKELLIPLMNIPPKLRSMVA